MADLTFSLGMDVSEVTRGEQQVETAFTKLQSQLTSLAATWLRYSTVLTSSRAPANQVTQNLDQMEKSMKTAGDEAQRSGNLLATMFEKIKNAASGIGSIVSGALSFFGGGLLMKAFDGLTGGMHALVQETIAYHDTLEKGRIAFTTFLGSAEEAEKVLQKLQRFAAETPFQFPEVVELATRLKAVGFEADKLVPTLRTLSDMSAALGGSADKLQVLVHVFGQMQSGARLTGIELRELQLAAVPVAEIVQKMTGWTYNQFRTLVEQGKISSRAFSDMIQEASNKMFGGMTQEIQRRTVEGQMSNVKDNTLAITSQMADGAIKTVINSLDVLNNTLGGEGATKFAQAVGSFVSAGLVPFNQFIGDLASGKGLTEAGVDAAKAFWNEFRETFVPMISEAWGWIQPKLTELGKSIAGAIASGFSAGWTAIKEGYDRLTKLVDQLLEYLGAKKAAAEAERVTDVGNSVPYNPATGLPTGGTGLVEGQTAPPAWSWNPMRWPGMVKQSYDFFKSGGESWGSVGQGLGLSQDWWNHPWNSMQNFFGAMPTPGGAFSPWNMYGGGRIIPPVEEWPGQIKNMGLEGEAGVYKSRMRLVAPAFPGVGEQLGPYGQLYQTPQSAPLVHQTPKQWDDAIRQNKENQKATEDNTQSLKDATAAVNSAADKVSDATKPAPMAHPAALPFGRPWYESLNQAGPLPVATPLIEKFTYEMMGFNAEMQKAWGLTTKQTQALEQNTIKEEQQWRTRLLTTQAWNEVLQTELPKTFQQTLTDLLTGAKTFHDSVTGLFAGIWQVIATKLSSNLIDKLFADRLNSLIETILNSIAGALTKGAGSGGFWGTFFGVIQSALGLVGAVKGMPHTGSIGAPVGVWIPNPTGGGGINVPNVPLTPTIPDLGGGMGPGFGGGYASGGPVFSGRAYMVGEQGPELFVPTSKGTIVPNNKMGGLAININLGGNQQESRKSREQIVAAARRELEWHT